MKAVVDPAAALADTQYWLERAVIGLKLCPFAKAVHQRSQIRFVVSAASGAHALAGELAVELQHLAAADPQAIDTTLLVHPQALQNFDEYNQFLDVADAMLTSLGLEGELQIASFHPNYRFEGSADDDISNCSNRSPYPTLHLLRESSVERAVETYPDTAEIYQRNIDTLGRLGWAGWYALVGR